MKRYLNSWKFPKKTSSQINLRFFFNDFLKQILLKFLSMVPVSCMIPLNYRRKILVVIHAVNLKRDRWKKSQKEIPWATPGEFMKQLWKCSWSVSCWILAVTMKAILDEILILILLRTACDTFLECFARTEIDLLTFFFSKLKAFLEEIYKKSEMKTTW